MSPRKRARLNPAHGGTSSLERASTASPKVATRISSGEPRRPSGDISSTMSTLSTEGLAASGGTTISSGPSRAASQKSGKQRNLAWFGSWPRAAKAPPSTQVACETISGDTLQPNSPQMVAGNEPNQTSTAKAMGSGAGDGASSSAMFTPIQNTDVDPALQVLPSTTVTECLGRASSKGGEDSTGVDHDGGNISSPLPELRQPSGGPRAAVDQVQRPATTSGWIEWLGRSANAAVKAPVVHTHSASPPVESSPPVNESVVGKVVETEQSPAPSTTTPLRPVSPAPTLWFGLWTRESWTKQQDQQRRTEPSGSKHTEIGGRAANLPEVQMPQADGQDARDMDVVSVDSPQAQPAGSTWAFWSRDRRPNARESGVLRQEPGEIAVIGQGSETHPQPAQSLEVQTVRSSTSSLEPPAPASPATAKDNARETKRPRSQPIEIMEVLERPADAKSPLSILPGSSKPVSLPTDRMAKSVPANLVLPSFRSTYRMKEDTSIMRQIARFLLRTQQAPSTNAVFITKEPPLIRKAIAIGVHGLFPAAYLRPMIGQPTGTSLKFANLCAESIRRWADAHGSEGSEIEKVALEGEGKIADRVENLWKLLLNWIDHIRSADLVILACHSQGVPVAIMLVARLIELGIGPAARIGVCAMAGVCLGPFHDYRSSMGMLMGSATELWDLANPKSDVSRRYAESLKTVLSYGVRITFIASLDDQVVPIESAVYSPAIHPYIYRAVFVDGRLHAPDFITNLVGLALRLRNLGVSDHGIVKELSVPLAGSLYSGEGHSRLYEDPQVYDLAVCHALETSNIGGVPCAIREHEGSPNSNPFHLPWAMRGFLEENFVKTELSGETSELLQQFDDWKPVTKALKDVKYRLEALRSKL